ncbi:site-specific integrase [Catalinimonas niigatensis]|uniref:site-specific integrase n=1 Tax=Catalinimonas niigatensis TaxID=1397264 RepID=UPI002666A7F2|nr:site-specific integrase [Catalinimonas niigatensis]WPP51756.1 site-specific integrase [Catalinimonas niigatensis]
MENKNTYSSTFLTRASKAKNGKAPVYCRITVNGQRVEFSIKRSVLNNQWDNGKVKGNNEEAKTLKVYLKQVEAKLFEHYREMLAKNALISAEDLKNAYLGLEKKQHTLLELIDYHNNHLRSTLEWGTMKNYFTTQSYIKEFLKERLRKKDIYLSQLSYQFLTELEMYLKSYKPKDHRKPMGQNTVMKHLERLRKMVNLAIKNEWVDKDPFNKFKMKFIKKDRGYLTQDELKRIEEKDFSVERLNQTRDIFVFSCYTGLSYAEVFDLKPEHIVIGLDGERWIRGQRKKSKELFKVPLLPRAKAIIERYKDHPITKANDKVLPVFTNQKTNAYLKEIAILCEVDKNLTYHLARHTFATTVTLSNGVPIESVSKMLGHTNLRTTQLYAKVVEQKLSEDMKMLKGKLTESSYEKKMTS